MERLIILKEPDNKINDTSTLFDNVQKINIDYTQENLIVFYLNTKNQIIDYEVLFKGGLNGCVADPRTIFRKALLKNANSIIIAHNHPSDSLIPSDEDREVFKTLKEAGELIGIRCVDSIIFNEKQYYSMRGN